MPRKRIHNPFGGKSMVISLEKLERLEVYLHKDGHYYQLTPFRPGGIYILQEVRVPVKEPKDETV